MHQDFNLDLKSLLRTFCVTLWPAVIVHMPAIIQSKTVESSLPKCLRLAHTFHVSSGLA